MSQPLIFDASALISIFRGYAPLLHLYREADLGRENLVAPVGAIVDANRVLKCSYREWDAVLWPGVVNVLHLAQHVAIEIGPWPGDIGVRHALYEARVTGGVLITRQPDQYVGADVEVYII